MLDVIAHRYGKLPSEIAKTPIDELQFDILVCYHAMRESEKGVNRGRKRS